MQAKRSPARFGLILALATAQANNNPDFGAEMPFDCQAVLNELSTLISGAKKLQLTTPPCCNPQN